MNLVSNDISDFLNARSFSKVVSQGFPIATSTNLLKIGFIRERFKLNLLVVALRALSRTTISNGTISSSLSCGRFHQHFTRSFYTHRSQKRKKRLRAWLYFFALWGSGHVKAACKILVKSTPELNFKFNLAQYIMKNGAPTGDWLKKWLPIYFFSKIMIIFSSLHIKIYISLGAPFPSGFCGFHWFGHT